MAAFTDFQFNISLGREVELYHRVDQNDPANSALIMLVLAASGLESVATLRDKDDVAALVSGTTNEVANTNYARKVLTDADLAAWAPDDTGDEVLLVLPVQTFTSIAAGDTWAYAVVAYDSDTTSGTDANVIPISAHVLRLNNAYVVPNGSNIVINLSLGWIRARST